MIDRIEIHVPTRTPIDWLKRVPFLSAPRTFEFKEGLNILWGPNGSGKSTLLQLMGTLLHATQGGRTTVTQKSTVAMTRSGFDPDPMFKEPLDLQGIFSAISLAHDGEGVWFVDPRHRIGADHGNLDDDFVEEGLFSAFRGKGSQGQNAIMAVQQVLDFLRERKIPGVDHRIIRDDVNDRWQRKLEVVDHYLTPTIAKGPITALMDEPDSSMAIHNQAKLWEILREVSSYSQVIVATHSVFAVGIPEAHYIEFADGYLEKAAAALKGHFGTP